MKWKPLAILLAIFMVLALAAPGMAARPDAPPQPDNPGDNQPSSPGFPSDPGNSTDDDDDVSGPPDEPTVDIEFISTTGNVQLVTNIYELKETLIAYDFDDNTWVELLVPVEEPSEVYFLTADEVCQYVVVTDQETGETIEEWTCAPPAEDEDNQWLLDFGPDWYAAYDCLESSYICGEDADGGEIKIGPFVLGNFTCNGDFVDLVESNDFNLADTDGFIPLMDRTSRDALDGAAGVYAFGRNGGSEVVWIYDPDGDGIFERYPKAGNNIVWEIDDGGGQAWWRGEAPPQAMTDELSCSITE